MIDIDTVARRAAQDLREAAASLPVPHVARWPRRAVLVLTVAASVALVVAAAVVLRQGDSDLRVATSPPAFSVDVSPRGDSGTIASGDVAGARWRLYVDGPSNEPCLAVTAQGRDIESSVCLGGPGGTPAADPFQPLVMADTRAPHLIGGRVPDTTARLLIEVRDGSPLEVTSFVRSSRGRFFVFPLGDGVPTATRAFDEDGTELERSVVPTGDRELANDLVPIDPGDGNRRLSDAVVVAEGDDDRGTWQLIVYESESGLCADLRFDNEGDGGGGGGCGHDVPERWALSAMGGGSPERQFVHGVVREDVVEVRVRLGSGKVASLETVGEELGYGVRFFAFAVPRADSARSVVGFDARGTAIARQELFPDPGPPENIEP